MRQNKMTTLNGIATDGKRMLLRVMRHAHNFLKDERRNNP